MDYQRGWSPSLCLKWRCEMHHGIVGTGIVWYNQRGCIKEIQLITIMVGDALQSEALAMWTAVQNAGQIVTD
jgi:hypothetical protein